ncbi:MAG TPA: hypothetical protein VE964_17900 [Myxococcales bacterium]|nr:hypothetical protein [Myxococcales bacterium]
MISLLAVAEDELDGVLDAVLEDDGLDGLAADEEDLSAALEPLPDEDGLAWLDELCPIDGLDGLELLELDCAVAAVAIRKPAAAAPMRSFFMYTPPVGGGKT